MYVTIIVVTVARSNLQYLYTVV